LFKFKALVAYNKVEIHFFNSAAFHLFSSLLPMFGSFSQIIMVPYKHV